MEINNAKPHIPCYYRVFGFSVIILYGHTNASLLISAGVDIVTLSGRLGHSDKGVTLNTYSHIIKSKEAEVANKMDIFYENLNSVPKQSPKHKNTK